MIVFVDVGPEKVRFKVHRGLLTHVSQYFMDVLRRVDFEFVGFVVTLEGEKPDAFRQFVEWLYNNFIAYQELEGLDVMPLFELYLLAERLIMHQLQNDVIDALIKFYNETKIVPCQEIRYAWQHADTDSGLRLLLKDFYVKLQLSSSFNSRKERQMQPKDFLVEVLFGFYKAKDAGRELGKSFDFWAYRCKYHFHYWDEVRCDGTWVEYHSHLGFVEF